MRPWRRNRLRSTIRSSVGFTFSELALVLVVLAGLLTIIVVSVNGLDGDEAERECRTELRTLKAATERFKAEIGFYPPTDQSLQEVDFLDLGDTPNWEVVTLDEAEGPTYRPIGSRCA